MHVSLVLLVRLVMVFKLGMIVWWVMFIKLVMNGRLVCRYVNLVMAILFMIARLVMEC